MLADPNSRRRPRDINEYTGNELDAALALLTVDNADNKKKRKQKEYWSDSDNDDWPKYDDDNEHPYDPTIKVPTEQRNVINLQQTANETKKQPPSKRSRPTGNAPATSMERLDYAIASRKNKPRGWSLGGRKTKRLAKRKTKRLAKAGCYTNKTKRLAKAGCYTNKTKRLAKRKTRRYNKRGGVKQQKSTAVKKTNNQIKKHKPVRIYGNDLYVQPATGNDYPYIVEVEDLNAPEGDNFAHMARLVGRDEDAITPTLNPDTGIFETPK
jgi:hypothetical protein